MHSKRQGDLYEYKIPDVGDDLIKIEQEITASNFYIEAMDVHALCSKATETLHKRLGN